MTVAIQAPTLKPAIQHLSWSGLSEYRTCPRRFFYHKIAGVPEESRSASLIFGGAIHSASEKLHEARIEGRKIPGIRPLLAAFDAAWKEESSQGPEVVFPKTDSLDSLRATAGRMLIEYAKHFQRDKGSIIAIEHDATFSLLAGVVPVKARLDLVTVEGRNLVVTDLKTSKSRWSDAKIGENLPQLVLYSAAATKMVRELGLERIVPRFVVLTKAKTPVVQVLEPKATQDDVARLKDLVRETSDAINKEVFPRREGWQCAQCPFAGRCLGRKGQE